MTSEIFQWLQIVLGSGILFAALKVSFNLGSMKTDVKIHSTQIPSIFKTVNAIDTNVTKMDVKLDSVIIRQTEHTSDCDKDRKRLNKEVAVLSSKVK